MYYLKEQVGKEFKTKEMSKTIEELSNKFWDSVLKAKEYAYDLDIRIVDSKDNIVDNYCYITPLKN